MEWDSLSRSFLTDPSSFFTWSEFHSLSPSKRSEMVAVNDERGVFSSWETEEKMADLSLSPSLRVSAWWADSSSLFLSRKVPAMWAAAERSWISFQL